MVNTTLFLWLIINPDTNELINVTLAPIIVKRFGFKLLRKQHLSRSFCDLASSRDLTLFLFSLLVKWWGCVLLFRKGCKGRVLVCSVLCFSTAELLAWRWKRSVILGSVLQVYWNHWLALVQQWKRPEKHLASSLISKQNAIVYYLRCLTGSFTHVLFYSSAPGNLWLGKMICSEKQATHIILIKIIHSI